METKRSAPLTVVFFALFHPVLAFAQQTQQPTGPQRPPWDWPGPWHMWSGGCWGFWWVFPLFLLVMIIICVAIFLLRHRSGIGHQHWWPWQMMDRGRSSGDPTHSALQILNERFAKGEIQKEEYEEKKAIILSSRQH